LRFRAERQRADERKRNQYQGSRSDRYSCAHRDSRMRGIAPLMLPSIRGARRS
jgi:hypothetical protein